MEALNFPAYGAPKHDSTQIPDHESDEGNDSFIEFDLPLHEFNGKALHEPTNSGGPKELDWPLLPKTTRSLPHNDHHFSKRKIIPIEPSSNLAKSLLISAKKFRAFRLRKSMSMANSSNTYIAEKTELFGISMETPKHEINLRKTEDSLFSKIIKPLYVKICRKSSRSDKRKVSGDLSISSPATEYPIKEKQGNRIGRRDDSLLVQNDGIQSAILHCKRSLNSSRESSWLSRCRSDSSHQF